MTDQVARPTQFGEVPAATIGIGIWLYFLAAQGVGAAAEALPILAVGVGIAWWTLGMRLRYSPTHISMSLPFWRRTADLEQLESITWKMTGGWRSRGTIFVHDRAGHRVPIYVGRFSREAEWSSLLLDAAARTGAKVDGHARRLLQHSGG